MAIEDRGFDDEHLTWKKLITDNEKRRATGCMWSDAAGERHWCSHQNNLIIQF